jgi:hypothetical protein
MAKTYDDNEEEFGGFGREAVKEAAKRPTYSATAGQVGERERREASVAGPLKPEKKRVVTKEELKKSGFTNLRDFLNAERGLKRRDGKKPDTQNDMSDKDRVRAQLDSAKELSKKGKLGTMKKGGMVSSASKRADGIAKKGKTKGRFV